jgi:predicted unusual protein kinase regulating ubiquinone biosynthesis (AarF/ABC1/UbiB family)
MVSRGGFLTVVGIRGRIRIRRIKNDFPDVDKTMMRTALINAIKSSVKRCGSRFAYALLLSQILSAIAYGVPTGNPEIDKLYSTIGPMVSRSDAPQSYRLLDEIFSDLSNAQRNLLDPKPVEWENKIYLLETPTLNAFVSTIKTSNGYVNHVSITTGLLDFFLSNPDKKLAVKMISGALAHELAHPFDKVDPQGLGGRFSGFGTKINSQAIEIRADTDAISILRAAGYPTDSLYQALDALKKSKREFFEAGIATHPEDSVRLSVQRQILTLQRYKRGMPIAKQNLPSTDGVLDELEKVADQTWRFVPPKTIDENLERIQRILGAEGISPDYRNVEFNRLLIYLDQSLLKTGSSLGPGQKKAFLRTMEIIANAKEGGPEIVRRPQTAKLLTRQNRSTEFLNTPDHFELMKRIPLYSEPSYRDSIAEAIRSTQRPRIKVGQISNLEAGLKVLPPAGAFETFNDELIKNFPSNFLQTTDLAKTDPDARLRLANLYYDQIAPKQNLADRFVGEVTLIRFRIPGFITAGPSDPKSEYSLDSILRDPKQIETKLLLQKVAQRIWNERGFYGIADLSSTGSSLQWKSIWKILGIDPQIGRNQLIQAVKQYARSPDYAEIVKTVKRQWPDLDEKNPRAWTDNTLWNYLSGDQNEAIKSDSELRLKAKADFGNVYLGNKRDVVTKKFEAYVRGVMESIPASSEDWTDRFWKTYRRPPELNRFFSTNFNDTYLIVEALKKTSVPDITKRAFLNDLLILGNRNAEGSGHWLHEEPSTVQAIQRYLQKQGLSNSPLETLEKTKSANAARGFSYALSKNWRVGSATLGDQLQSQFETGLKQAKTPKGKLDWIERWTRLLDFSSVTPPPSRGMDQSSGEIKIKNAVVDALLELKLSPEERMSYFLRLTSRGPTVGTDHLLQGLLNDAEWTKHQEWIDRVNTVFDKKLISSDRVKAALAQPLLEESFKTGSIRSASEAVDWIKRKIPAAGAPRDHLIEETAWRLGVTGNELSQLESEKSTNFKQRSPLLVNLASGIAEEVGKLSADTRSALIRHLTSPSEFPFPEADLTRELAESLAKDMDSRGKKFAEEELRKKNVQFSDWIRDSTSTERIPLLELLLDRMKQDASSNASFESTVMRDFLGYKAGSNEEKLLKPFLKVIPNHERTVTLAYLLSQKASEKGSIASLFEVFQTVGIKFGQMSSVWKLFGEEVAKETAQLKDNAEPMTKAEVEEFLDKTLTPEERSQITLRKVLGSASLKTVVLADLKDGRQVAILIQRPYAHDQVNGNIELSLKYVKELKDSGVDLPSGMFDSVVHGLREQLADEMIMSREAVKISQAGSHFSEENGRLQNVLNGWKFNVPQQAAGFQTRDNILFLDVAKGTTWSRASPEVREQTGRAIAEASLDQLFQKGWFDPDRHAGNFMVDPATKTIYAIDFGQAVNFHTSGPWSSDDRVVFANFLSGISRHDDLLIAKSALDMRDPSLPMPALEKVRTAVRSVLRANIGKADEDVIPAVLNAIADSGVRMKSKFSFGAIKGLLLLGGEGYVSSEEFGKIVQRQITHLALKKPGMLLDQTRSILRTSGDAALCIIQGLQRLIPAPKP